MNKLKMESMDMTQANIDKIAELFPQVVTEVADPSGAVDSEGKPMLRKAIDFEKLKWVLSAGTGDYVVAEDEQEKYEFTWVGKLQAMIDVNTPIRKTLRPCPAESKNWETTENLYIEGDNLEVLKLLKESYSGKVKMIYIDPPYNTGNDFIFKDNFAQSREEYVEELNMFDEEGYCLFKNTESNGRFHSAWCTMIFPRLQLAKELLTNDGVIVISIDDNEMRNMRNICDEIFGETNFISMMVVNRASEIATDKTVQKHEYCLFYAKKYELLGLCGDKKYTVSRGTVGNEDQTMPEILFPKGLKCINIPDGEYTEARIIKDSRENIEVLSPFIVKNGVLALPVTLKARWRSSNDMRNYFDNNCKPTPAKINGIIEEIYFDGDRLMPYIKKLVIEKIPSLFLGNKRGSTDLESLKINHFDFPKSVSFIKYLTSLFSKENDIIMDFFSGSATTAEAVMQLNNDKSGKRKYIMVQLPENLDESIKIAEPQAKKTIERAIKFIDTLNRPHILSEIGKERIRRAGDKIVRERLDRIQEEAQKEGVVVDSSSLDTGFRVFKLDTTNMKDVYYAAGQLSQQDLWDTLSNIKDDRSDIDLLYSCLLDWGVRLTLPHTTEQIETFTVHTVNSPQTDEIDLIACFDSEVSETVVRIIAKRKPTRALFRDSSFADSANKINVFEIFKSISPDTTVKVI